MITAVDSAMTVIEEDVIHEREISIHTYARIATGVACPKVVVKSTIQAANRAAKRVVVDVEGFGKNRVLDGDVDRGQLKFLSAFGGLIHMPIHRHVFVEPPGS